MRIKYPVAVLAGFMAVSASTFANDIEAFKEMARKRSLLEQEIKLAEMQKKLTELKNGPSTSGGANGMPLPPGLPPQMPAPLPLAAIESPVRVARVSSFAGNATATIVVDGRPISYAVGDVLAKFGRISSITIKGVTACQATKCKSFPLQNVSQPVTELTSSSGSVPPAPPMPLNR